MKGGMSVKGRQKQVSYVEQDDADLNDSLVHAPHEEFNARKYVKSGCTVRDVEMWKEVFDLFDIDGNGSLTPMNIRNAMQTLGYNAKRQIIFQIVSDLDSDESGGVDFDEFVKMMTEKPCEKDTDEDIQDVFFTYDAEKKGYITKEDMLRTAKELKEELTEEEADIIFREVAPKGEEKISLKAWMQFMKKKTYDNDIYEQALNN